jgi:hypothetical protein
MAFLNGVFSLSLIVKDWRRSTLLLFCIVLCNDSLLAQASAPSEYEVKAAFLYNFAKFVEWPKNKPRSGEPIFIGILGDDPFGEDMEKTVQGKSVNGHPIVIRRYKGDKPPEYCQILFISSSERRRVDRLLEMLKGSVTLTVSEMDQFCERGGMINFRIESSKVRFEVNHRAAESEGLKISSKLLSVAVRVFAN